MQPLPPALMQPGDVHVIGAMQLPGPMQVTSHAHDAPHATERHDCAPVQLTSHGPGPHAMLRHELVPVHSIVHDAAAPQLMPLRHALSPLHWKSQW